MHIQALVEMGLSLQIAKEHWGILVTSKGRYYNNFISKGRKIESDMGLNPGSLQNGFKIREVSGISSMNPRSPLEGNEYFLGGGQHLPGGAPEMVINSIPTTDNASVTTILTVLVK